MMSIWGARKLLIGGIPRAYAESDKVVHSHKACHSMIYEMRDEIGEDFVGMIWLFHD